MSRIVSVWLPRWPIQRFLAAQAIDPDARSDRPVDPERPFVLVVAGPGGPRIAALNVVAEQAGLACGELLADARAKAEFLQVRALDALADAAALRRLALWATRYTPTASPWLEEFGCDNNGADGFFLDIEGSAHLFGGEAALIADLLRRIEGFGLIARIAVAATPGAAWAVSRFNRSALVVLPSGEEAAMLKTLPIEALRLTLETRAALRRLGFKTISRLIDQPRAPFAARFAAELLNRLDQALGRRDEPLVPIIAPPVYHSLHYWLDPVVTTQAIVNRAERLMQNLVRVLTRDDVGARALRLCLYRVDGAVKSIAIGLTLPTRSVAHVTRLIELKLETLVTGPGFDFDVGFGVEAIGLAVTRAEPMPARQIELDVGRHPEALGGAASFEGHLPSQDDDEERCAALIDALRQRLGPHRVRRFEPVASHLPERAEALPAADGETSVWPSSDQARPLLLLPRAEPTEVTALVPEGPPRRFSWRGVTYDVAGAQGPERIASEWWRASFSAHSRASGNPELGPRFRGDERQNAFTRDYYLVEDANGRRFWLYREGLYGRETLAARWFVQGMFA